LRRIVITGAAGFLGVNLSQRLLEVGHSVIGVDVRDRHGRLSESAVAFNPDFTFIPLDLARNQLPAVTPPPSAIIHLAALPQVDYSCLFPAETISNNTSSLLSILEVAVNWKVPVLFTSSQECYGGTVIRSYVESDASFALSPYAASKVAGEAIIQSYVGTRNLRATVVRLANLYGNWQAPDRLIPRILSRLLFGQSVEVDAGTTRDYLHVRDACAGIEAILEQPFVGEAFNVSTGMPQENGEVGDAISGLLGAPLPKRTTRRGDDGRGRYLVACPTKLYEATGWMSQTSLHAGLSETVHWYKEHGGWLEQFSKQIRASRSSSDFLTDYGWNNQD